MNTDEMIEVMQAYTKGEAIKIRNVANFQDVNNLYPILSTGFRPQKQKKG